MRYTDILQICFFSMRRPFSVRINSKQVGPFEIGSECPIYLVAQQRKKNDHWVAKTTVHDKKPCQVQYEQESSCSKLNERQIFVL